MFEVVVCFLGPGPDASAAAYIFSNYTDFRRRKYSLDEASQERNLAQKLDSIFGHYTPSRPKSIEWDLDQRGGADFDDGEDEVIEMEEQDSDAITTDNVLKEFKLGLNKFDIEYDEVETGVFEVEHVSRNSEEVKSLKQIVTDFFEPNEDTDDDKDGTAVIVESKWCNVAMWKENGVFYLFDPNPK